MKKHVVIGFFGTVLDKTHKASKRWHRWRPTVSLTRQADRPIDRMELFVPDIEHRSVQILLEDIAAVSPDTVVNCYNLGLEDPWDFEEVFGALHQFASGYDFQPEEEEYLIHITTGTHVAQICLFLLTEARYFPGQLLQTMPPKKEKLESGQERPRDYVVPPGKQVVIDLDLSKYDQIARRFQEEQDEGRSFLKSGIQTRSKDFNKLIDTIEKVAIGSAFPILLMGPTGAGKTRLARRIYDLKRQRRQVEGKFVDVNCATLRGEGAMSALFGHKRGAFTGAQMDRPGLLKTADRGVLFLDEIGELGLDEQAMLLRALESGTFLPVGSDQEVHSRFQLIAGTNCDLWEDVRRGRFREDLLARINLWTFELPSLRERREDIEPNLVYELSKVGQLTGRKITFNKEALERFLRFATAPDALWCGNFRDLNAAMSRMGTLAPAGRINETVVLDEIERLQRQWRGPQTEDDQILSQFLSAEELEDIDQFERPQLALVLKVLQSSRSMADAGRKLFQASRRKKKSSNDSDRLRKYLERFDLTAKDIFESGSKN